MRYVKSTLLLVAIVVAVSTGLKAQIKNVSAIGAAIPEETALSWIQNFKTKFPDAIASHTVDKGPLQIMLSMQGTAGIYLYNGLSAGGKVTLILKAADDNGDIINAVGDLADQQMADNFHAKFSDRAQAQLVGKEIIQALLSREGTVSMTFIHAIDDKGQERLVYVGINDKGQWTGDTGDSSLPCPPYCPKRITVSSSNK